MILQPLKQLKPYFVALPLAALTAIVLTLALQKHAKPQGYDSCGTLLHHGQWLRNDTQVDPTIWQPQDCTLHHYTADDIAQCIKPDSRIIFLGDSTARKVFLATARLLDSGITHDFGRQANMYITRRNITLHLFFDTYLEEEAAFGVVKKMAQNAADVNHTTYLYATTGLWHSKYKPRDKVMKAFRKSVDDLVDVLKNQIPGAFERVYFGPTQLPLYEKLDEGRNKVIIPFYLDQMHNYTDHVFNYNPLLSSREPGNNGTLYTHDGRVAAYYAPVFNKYGPGHSTLYDQYGLHYLDPVTYVQAQTLLNHLCNGKIIKPEMVPHETTCCIPYQKPTKTHEIMIYALLLLSLGMTVLILIPERFSPTTLHSIISIIAMTLLAALYAYLCDRTHQLNKQYSVLSWYEFFALSQMFLVIIAFSLSRARSAASATAQTTFLGNPTLIVEWKGLAIGLWLMAKLTGLSRELNEGDVFCRILAATLIFSETYGFAFEIMSGEAGVVSFLSRLLRINAFAVLLACSLGTDYFFYELPAKLTFWYVFVFIGYYVLKGKGIATLVNWVRVTRSEITTSTPNFFLDLAKLGLLTVSFGFAVFFTWTPFSENVLEYSVDLRDEFSVGIAAVLLSVVVTNEPLVSALAWQIQSKYVRIIMTGIAGAVGIILVNFYFFASAFTSADEYKSIFHQIGTLGFIFVYVTLRSHLLGSMAKDSFLYSAFLELLGSCWLEMFLLSYHAYLAGDGTLRLYLLTTGTTDDNSLGLDIRRVANFVILTLVFVLVCRRLATAWEDLEASFSEDDQRSPCSASSLAEDSSSFHAIELYDIEDEGDSMKGEDNISTSDRLLVSSSSDDDTSDLDEARG